MVRTLLLALLISSTLFTACSTDDPGPTDPKPDPVNSFRVNGSGISNVLVTSETALTKADEVLASYGIIQLGGTTNGTPYRLQLKLRGIAVDTVAIDQAAGIVAILDIGSGSAAGRYQATSGSIGVSAWSGAGGSAEGTFDVTLDDGTGQHTITVTGSFKISPVLGDPVNAIRVDGGMFSNVLIPAYQPSGSTGASQSLAGDGVVTMVTDLDGAMGTFTLSLKDVDTGAFPISQISGNAAAFMIDDDGSITSFFGKSGTVTIESWGGVGGSASGYFEVIVSEGLNADPITVIGSFQVASITPTN